MPLQCMLAKEARRGSMFVVTSEKHREFTTRANDVSLTGKDLKKVLKDLRRARPVDKQRQLAYRTSEFANPLFPPFLQVTHNLPLRDAGLSLR